MRFFFTFGFLKQVKAYGIRDQSQNGYQDHGFEIGKFFIPEKPSQHFSKTEHCERDLNISGKFGYSFFSYQGTSNGEKTDSIDKRIREHIKAVSNKAHGF